MTTAQGPQRPPGGEPSVEVATLVPRDTAARLLARSAQRHADEIAQLQDAERVALARVDELVRTNRELRRQLREVDSEHATERMNHELEVARLRAEIVDLRTAAARRELHRPDERETERPGGQDSEGGRSWGAGPPQRRDEIVLPDAHEPPRVGLLRRKQREPA